MKFLIKQNDTAPAIEYVLSPDSINLSGATVVFNMRDTSGAIKINRGSASVTTATGTPTVRYNWTAENTDTAGLFQAEFEVTYSDGSIETFPNSNYIIIQVGDDIA